MIKKRKKANHTPVYIFSVIVTFIIFALFYFGVLKVNIPTSHTQTNDTTWTSVETWTNNTQDEPIYADSIVEWTWKLFTIPYNIKASTKYKLRYNWKDLYVKSDDYLLDDYVWKNISFKADVIWFFDDNSPILNINDIKVENQANEQLTWTEIEIKENNKLAYLKWLKIDLTDTNYFYKKNGDNIVIYKTGANLTWNNEIVNISYSKCKKWSSMYDCEALKKYAQIYKYKTITSNDGAVYYNLPETDTYQVIKWNYIYNFNFKDENSVYDIISKSTVKDVLQQTEDIAKNICKWWNISLSSIEKITKLADDKYDVIGFDEYSNKIECMFSVNMESDVKIAKLEKLVYYEKEKNNKIQESTKQTENKETEKKEDKTEVLKDEQLDESKYLVYKSRWYKYTLYMPKSVKYKSILINNDLWVSGLKCKQQTNIADWKNGDLKSPDVKVVYCETNLNKDIISSWIKNKYPKHNIEKVAWKTFIIIYKNKELADKIVIK